MKHSIFLLIFTVLLSAVSQFELSTAEAEPAANTTRRGLITTGSCPLTCGDLGVVAEFCRESRIGNKCSVEDLSQPPGHRSVALVPRKSRVARRSSTIIENSTVFSEPEKGLSPNAAVNDPKRRGLVTTSSCPFTCEDAGVPADSCREKQVGSRCTVEDLRQPAGHRSMVRVP